MTTYNVITGILKKVVFVTFFKNRTLKKERREKKMKPNSSAIHDIAKKAGEGHLYLREVVGYEQGQYSLCYANTVVIHGVLKKCNVGREHDTSVLVHHLIRAVDSHLYIRGTHVNLQSYGFQYISESHYRKGNNMYK